MPETEGLDTNPNDKEKVNEERSEKDQLRDLYKTQKETSAEILNKLAKELDAQDFLKLLFEEARSAEEKTADKIDKRIDRNTERIDSIKEEIRDAKKLEYDYNKHLTTLSTGSILVIAAAIRAFFPDLSDARLVWLLYGSFLLLLSAVIFSALAMKFSITGTLAVGDESDKRVREHAGRLDTITWMFFSTGIFSFSTFVVENANPSNGPFLYYLAVLAVALWALAMSFAPSWWYRLKAFRNRTQTRRTDQEN